MKTVIQTLPWAILLLARVNAQDDPNADAEYQGDNVVTSYYTLCPSSTSSSSSWPTGTGTMTVGPNELTRTGDDGRTTIYRTETTILPHMCPGGDGVCGATYTLTEECPCTAGPKTVWTHASCPEGFTTTAVECTACASNGGPSTVTVTTPIPSGPYGSVTPIYGSPVNNPSDISSQNTPSQTGTPDNNNSGSGSNSSTPSGDSSNNSGMGPDKNGNSGPDNSTPSSSDTSGGRYGSSGNSNGTKPYSPNGQTYAGAAGKLEISIGGCMSVIGAGVIGALAIFL